MKTTSTSAFLLAAALLCAAAAPASAQERSKEELQLQASAAELDKSAARPGGEQRVAHKIKAQFGVDGARVLGLHYKELHYGEIAVVLGQGMPGVLKKDESLHKIVALRQGTPEASWGRIAKELGLKLGPAAVKVRNIASEVHRLERASKARKETGKHKEKKTAVPEKGESRVRAE